MSMCYHCEIVVDEVHDLLILELRVANHVRKQHGHHDLRTKCVCVCVCVYASVCWGRGRCNDGEQSSDTNRVW